MVETTTDADGYTAPEEQLKQDRDMLCVLAVRPDDLSIFVDELGLEEVLAGVIGGLCREMLRVLADVLEIRQTEARQDAVNEVLGGVVGGLFGLGSTADEGSIGRMFYRQADQIAHLIGVAEATA
jgi:hypothetical protein